MGTNMYPSSALLGQSKDGSLESLPVDELIEKADGFAGVFPGTAPLRAYLFWLCNAASVKLNYVAFVNLIHVMQSTSMRSSRGCKRRSTLLV
jgi:hypothetical protein